MIEAGLALIYQTAPSGQAESAAEVASNEPSAIHPSTGIRKGFLNDGRSLALWSRNSEAYIVTEGSSWDSNKYCRHYMHLDSSVTERKVGTCLSTGGAKPTNLGDDEGVSFRTPETKTSVPNEVAVEIRGRHDQARMCPLSGLAVDRDNAGVSMKEQIKNQKLCIPIAA